jgi:aryl-alcohol dehydrogenase-like predicted oxidoreductase
LQTIRFGRTDAQVSVVGLGCGGASRLGMARGASAESAANVVRRALDLGVTFIDTARAYGTEEAVGLGIRGRREGVFISTKFNPGLGEQHLTAAELTASLEQSLRRLGTDHVDVFHLHGLGIDQYDRAVDVAVPELRRQQAAGKLRFLGVTEAFGPDPGHAMLTRALPDDLFDVIMVGFNLMNPSARTRVFPDSRRRDVGTLIMFAVRRALRDWSALQQSVAKLVSDGEIDGAALDPGDPLGFLRQYAASGQLTEIAYRFCRHEPGADVVLTGTGDVLHLEANVRAMQGPPLPGEALARLERMFGAVDSVSGN